MDFVSTFSFVSIVLLNGDIVIVVSTLCIVSNVNSAQHCKSHVMFANKNCLKKIRQV